MESRYHYISKSIVNMHAEPKHMCEVISQGIYGTPITIVNDKESSWVHIQTPDKYRGWIQKKEMISRETPYPTTPSIAQVEAIWTHLYWVDDVSRYPPAITIPFETKVEVIPDSKIFHQPWIAFRLIDGKIVWGKRGDFKLDPKPLSLKEMIQLSHRFLKIPYRWGGSSSFGFDCSGFVQTLYRQVGITLSRDAKDQVNMSSATTVKLENLQQGDLVFFGNSPSKITHVGMALDNKQFIHAVTSNQSGHHVIQVSSLSDPEWLENTITARRYPL